jgi:phosphoglucosamine mutase
VKILAAKNISLAEATKELKMYPEISFNLRDVSKEVLKIPEVKAEIKNMQKNLGANGKIVVRPSGTEPVIRISVSAECGEEAEAYLERIVELLKGWGR